MVCFQAYPLIPKNAKNRDIIRKMQIKAVVNGQTFEKEAENLKEFINFLVEVMDFELSDIEKVEKVN